MNLKYARKVFEKAGGIVLAGDYDAERFVGLAGAGWIGGQVVCVVPSIVAVDAELYQAAGVIACFVVSERVRLAKRARAQKDTGKKS